MNVIWAQKVSTKEEVTVESTSNIVISIKTKQVDEKAVLETNGREDNKKGRRFTLFLHQNEERKAIANFITTSRHSFPLSLVLSRNKKYSFSLSSHDDNEGVVDSDANASVFLTGYFVASISPSSSSSVSSCKQSMKEGGNVNKEDIKEEIITNNNINNINNINGNHGANVLPPLVSFSSSER